MKFRLFLLPLLLAAMDHGCEAYTVTIDPTARYQTLEGWGTSLAFMAHMLGDFPDPVRDQFADLMFSPTRGLGLTIARYNIGGGENPSLHFLPKAARVPGYEPSPGVWDWNADPGQRWLLRAGIARGVTIVEGFANSPPWWMTISGSVTGGWNGGNNLKTSCWSTFPDYLAAVAEHFYKDYGMPFRTLEPLNEPVSNWWVYGDHQEGCHFYQGSNQTSIINTLAADLKAAGVATTVSAPDDNSINDALEAVKGFGKETLRNLAQFNTHSYNGEKREKLYHAALKDHKRLWMSEYGDGDTTGITLAMRINNDMNNLHPCAWCYWQVIDNTPGWAMLWNPGNGRDYTCIIKQKYWVYANFTKFIRPGSVIIGTNDPTYTTAAMNAGNNILTMVTTNPGGQDQTVTYDLSKLNTAIAQVAAYQTSREEDLAAIPIGPISNHRLTLTMPGGSVTTVVFTGVTNITE